jgi:hypothetical protein
MDQERGLSENRTEGTGARSDRASPALVVIYLVILVWAALAWIHPGGP